MVVSSVTTLTAAQQQAAASVLGHAFAKDSFMSYVLPDPTTRIQKLTKLLLPTIRSGLRQGGVEIAPGGGALVWVPGQMFSGPSKLIELIRSGVIWLPWSIGLSACKRRLAHDSVCEYVLKTHAQNNFAYLWVVGVHPDHTGQGLGKKLVLSALDNMRRQGYSTCFLRTENPGNVGLYEHLGFKQVHTETPASSGHQYWLMSQELV
ncbi:MAG: GNAT family N-acetyltransferase [Cyanobacteria bacterium P01_G01_bin.4]